MERVDIGWVDPGYVSGHFTRAIAKQAVDMEYFGIMGDVHAAHGTSILAKGRNAVVAEFLEGDSDYLWFVDTDMTFSHGHIIDLMNMAKETRADMVTGLAFIFRHGDQPVPSIFYEGGPPFYPEGTLLLNHGQLPEDGQEIAACGLASALIHRRVFEALEAPRHPDYRWFDQIIMPSGNMSGEDTQFFHRARAAGFILRACTTARTMHIKEVGIGVAEWEKYLELMKSSEEVVL